MIRVTWTESEMTFGVAPGRPHDVSIAVHVDPKRGLESTLDLAGKCNRLVQMVVSW